MFQNTQADRDTCSCSPAPQITEQKCNYSVEQPERSEVRPLTRSCHYKCDMVFVALGEVPCHGPGSFILREYDHRSERLLVV